MSSSKKGQIDSAKVVVQEVFSRFWFRIPDYQHTPGHRSPWTGCASSTAPPRIAPARGPPRWDLPDAGAGGFAPHAQPAELLSRVVAEPIECAIIGQAR